MAFLANHLRERRSASSPGRGVKAYLLCARFSLELHDQESASSICFPSRYHTSYGLEKRHADEEGLDHHFVQV